jgi:hypothetical protein
VTLPARRVGILALLLCAVAAPVSAQTPLTLPPGSPLAPTSPDQPRRAPFTITPSFTITGEYNDNVFLNNENRVSDFILGLTPGIAVAAESSIYRLIASYSFTAEVYGDEEQLNDAFARQTLLLEGSYRVSPALTLSLGNALYVSKNTNVVTAENVSTGRTRSVTNTLSPGVAYQFDARTTLRGVGTWTTQRYDSEGSLDSDTYALEAFIDYALTPRLTLIGGYQFAYFVIDQTPDTVTHTPRVGASYRFTPTLTGTLTAGPTVIVPENTSASVTPAVTAALQQRFSWGSATLQYDRAVGTAGGLGGTSENQSIGAVVQVDRLVQGLLLQAVPRYTSSSSSSGSPNRIDVEGFSLTLQGRYQLTAWMAALAGYTFYHQRSSSSVTTGAGTVAATDVDQNRVFVGIQFGYPIVFD